MNYPNDFTEPPPSVPPSGIPLHIEPYNLNVENQYADRMCFPPPTHAMLPPNFNVPPPTYLPPPTYQPPPVPIYHRPPTNTIPYYPPIKSAIPACQPFFASPPPPPPPVDTNRKPATYQSGEYNRPIRSSPPRSKRHRDDRPELLERQERSSKHRISTEPDRHRSHSQPRHRSEKGSSYSSNSIHRRKERDNEMSERSKSVGLLPRSRDNGSRLSSQRPSHAPPRAERNSSPSSQKRLREEETERSKLLSKWRSNFCETPDEITKKLAQLDNEVEKQCWIRSSPADVYYTRTTANEVEATGTLETLCQLFEDGLVNRGQRARAVKPPYEPATRNKKQRMCRHRCKLNIYFFCIDICTLKKSLERK